MPNADGPLRAHAAPRPETSYRALLLALAVVMGCAPSDDPSDTTATRPDAMAAETGGEPDGARPSSDTVPVELPPSTEPDSAQPAVAVLRSTTWVGFLEAISGDEEHLPTFFADTLQSAGGPPIVRGTPAWDRVLQGVREGPIHDAIIGESVTESVVANAPQPTPTGMELVVAVPEPGSDATYHVYAFGPVPPLGQWKVTAYETRGYR